MKMAGTLKKNIPIRFCANKIDKNNAAPAQANWRELVLLWCIDVIELVLYQEDRTQFDWLKA